VAEQHDLGDAGLPPQEFMPAFTSSAISSQRTCTSLFTKRGAMHSTMKPRLENSVQPDAPR
jgi:hypothetical protein